MTFRPLLAATLKDLATVRFPVMASPKLDGFRCIIRDSVALSRSLIPFRNQYVQNMLISEHLDGLDGELIVGSPTEEHVLNRTYSGVMSADGTPDFKFYVFDTVKFEDQFKLRYEHFRFVQHPFVVIVPQVVVNTIAELEELESKYLIAGYEGIMLRNPYAYYKHGRSTLREATLMKFKRFQDSEGVVIAVKEGVNNQNEFTRAATGAAQRSHHQENMVKSGQIGTLIVKDLTTEAEINVSPGRMTHAMRQFYWKQPEKLIGIVVKYKWFDYGVVDAPRFATFQAIRCVEDL